MTKTHAAATFFSKLDYCNSNCCFYVKGIGTVKW